MKLTLDQALIKGVEAQKAGQVTEADRYYTAIIELQTKNPNANYNINSLALDLGRVQNSLLFFKTALKAIMCIY